MAAAAVAARLVAVSLLLALLSIVSASDRAASAASAVDGTAGSKPHIVFILQDDLGKHDVAFDNSTAVNQETYNVSMLARDGIVLNRHYTHWHCSPTRRSFLSGRLPIHHGEQLSEIASDDLDLRWTLLPRKLKQAGYQTHWIGKGHTGYASYHQLPTQMGFDSYIGYLSGSQSYNSSSRWENGFPLNNNTMYSSDLYGQAAVKLVEEHDPATPMFMYLAWQAVHTPYDPVPDWRDEDWCQGYSPQDTSIGSRYCGMLWRSDRYVGQLVQSLKDKGMYDNTLIVFSSDNGGVGEGINYPLRGEKHSNWEGGLRTAAFVSGGLVPTHLRGTSSDIVMHISDWYPTLCGLAGVSGTDDPPLPPAPVSLNDPNKDIYGNASFPPVDGVDVWGHLMSGSTNTSAVHQYLTLSKEVLIAGDWKLLVAQPNFKTQNNGWKYPNGSWVTANASEYACSAQDGPLSQVLPGVSGLRPCLFNVQQDEREMVDYAPNSQELLRDLWLQLNRSVLTSFLHGASGPEGNPGQIARCSPPALLGPCNQTCAAAYFGVGEKRRVAANSDDTCSMHVLQHKAFHTGQLLDKVNATSPDECCALCQSKGKGCTHWTFNPNDPPPCHLKTGDIGIPISDTDCTSGSLTAPPTTCFKSNTNFPVCGVPGCNV